MLTKHEGHNQCLTRTFILMSYNELHLVFFLFVCHLLWNHKYNIAILFIVEKNKCMITEFLLLGLMSLKKRLLILKHPNYPPIQKTTLTYGC